MPKHTFFSAVDASASNTSAEFAPGCDQDFRWLLHVSKSGTDADPNLFVEEEVDGTWTCIQNPVTFGNSFPLDEDLVGVKDSYFMGKNMRLRTEANGTTTGTITATIHYKSKV